MSHLKHKTSQSQLATDSAVPMMPIRDIISCMAEMGMTVYEEDLQRPSQAVVQQIFVSLLERLVNISKESMERPRTTLLGMMQHKELYFDALTFAMFFRHCRELALLCGLPNFTQSDMLRPEARRLQTILSAILNFAKFQDEHEDFFFQLVDKAAKEKEGARKLREDIARVEQQIEVINERHESERPKIEEAQKENERLRTELLEFRVKQQRLRDEYEHGKNELTALLQQCRVRSEELAEQERKNEEIKSRIVRSPDRIKQSIADMSRDLAQARKEESNLQKRVRDMASKQRVMDDLEMSLKSLVDLEKGVQQDLKRISDVQREISHLKDQLHAKTVELQSADARILQLNRQIENAGEKLKRQQDMSDDMRSRAKARMDALRAEHAAKAKERGQYHKEFEVRQIEKKALEDGMASYRTATARQLSELLAEYQKTKDEMITYMATLDESLGLASYE